MLLGLAGQDYTILDIMSSSPISMGYSQQAFKIQQELVFSNLKAALMSGYDDLVPGSGRRKNHTDPTYCCWLLRVGWARLTLPSGQQYEAKSGQWVIVPAGLKRSQDFLPGTRILSLRLSVQQQQGVPLFASPAPIVFSAQDQPQLEQAGLKLLTTYQGIKEPEKNYPAACHSAAALLQFLGLWWAQVARHWQPWEGVGDGRMTELIALLSQHQSPQVPWPQLMARLQKSRRQLDRLLIDSSGLSVNAWLQRELLRKAGQALITSALPIKAIAQQLGFADASSFARWYRQHSGISPRQERMLRRV